MAACDFSTGFEAFAANVVIALQRLDMPARFAGKVGDDSFGACLRNCLADDGVDAFLRSRPAFASG